MIEDRSISKNYQLAIIYLGDDTDAFGSGLSGHHHGLGGSLGRVNELQLFGLGLEDAGLLLALGDVHVGCLVQTAGILLMSKVQ